MSFTPSMSTQISVGSDAGLTPEQLAELRKSPLRCDHCRKSTKELGISKMKLCSACSSAPYCSVECQRLHWKRHKVDCRRVTSGELLREALSDPIGNIGDGHRTGTRSMGKVLQDLGAWAEAHNGLTLTVVAWQALGLLGDIEARKSKVLILGLCRTTSTTPKMYYTLKDAHVASVAELKQRFKHHSSNPGRILREQEQIRQADGAIGAMLVMSVEQTEDDPRSVMQALGEISTMTFQPLGVCEEHRTSFQRIGQLRETVWKASLGNALRGGVFLPVFRAA
ncbi:hypothetical protein C8R46DRAFT_938641 [Mycena filopes]|nr:hypothetical protein C8R46DRAFT_938641 [Mycena filopes]